MPSTACSRLFCFVGYFNGCGKTMFVMAKGVVGAFCVRLPAVYLMSQLNGASLFHIGLGTPISSVAQIILCVVAYHIYQNKQKTTLSHLNFNPSAKPLTLAGGIQFVRLFGNVKKSIVEAPCGGAVHHHSQLYRYRSHDPAQGSRVCQSRRTAADPHQYAEWKSPLRG